MKIMAKTIKVKTYGSLIVVVVDIGWTGWNRPLRSESKWPNVKLSHPERANELLENDQLPVAGSSTLGAKRIRVGCSALFGRITTLLGLGFQSQ